MPTRERTPPDLCSECGEPHRDHPLPGCGGDEAEILETVVRFNPETGEVWANGSRSALYSWITRYEEAKRKRDPVREAAREVVRARYESDSWEELSAAIRRLADMLEDDVEP